MQFPILETTRLTLREFNPAIRDHVFENYPQEQQLNFFGAEDAIALADLRSRFEYGVIHNDRISFCAWFLIEKKSQKVIGHAGYHLWFTTHFRAEIGYQIQPEFQKQGLMTEALKVIITAGFEQMNLNRIEAFVSPNNTPSLLLMDRYRFKREGLHQRRYFFKDQWEDVLSFSLLKQDYKKWLVKKRPIEELIEDFESLSLPLKKWTHEAHLSTALWYLTNYRKEEALCMLRAGIIAYNVSQGGKNTSTSGYHETITLFWVWAIDNYLTHFGRGNTFEENQSRFLNSKYAQKEFPLQYYSKERLMSTLARSQWIDPDLKKLEFEGL